MVLGYAEGGEVLDHRGELLHAPVEELIFALQSGEGLHGLIGGEKFQQLPGGFGGHGKVVHQQLFHFLGADLLQLVDGAHHVGRLRLQTQEREEAV